MKTRKLELDVYSTELVFAIGQKSEIKEFLGEKIPGEEAFKQIVGTKCGVALTPCKTTFNLETGRSTFIVMIIVDTLGLRKIKDVNLRTKLIKKTFHHELRHMVDLICKTKKLDLNDLENTANLSAFIVTEFEETRDEYFESDFKKVLKEEAKNE